SERSKATSDPAASHFSKNHYSSRCSTISGRFGTKCDQPYVIPTAVEESLIFIFGLPPARQIQRCLDFARHDKCDPPREGKPIRGRAEQRISGIARPPNHQEAIASWESCDPTVLSLPHRRRLNFVRSNLLVHLAKTRCCSSRSNVPCHCLDARVNTPR